MLLKTIWLPQNGKKLFKLLAKTRPKRLITKGKIRGFGGVGGSELGE